MNIKLCKPQQLKVGDLMISYGVIREVVKIIPGSQTNTKISPWYKFWDKILCYPPVFQYDDSYTGIFTKYPGEEAYEREPFIIDNRETLPIVE